MIVRKIREAELLEAHRISALSFHWPLDDQGKNPEEYAKAVRENPHSKGDSSVTDTWAAFTEDNEMMSSICVLPYQVAFDGHQAAMAGIGSVCTYPQHRRKGAVKAIFSHFLTELNEKKVPFSYLYPFSEQFYGNFGYHRSCASTLWDFDLKTIPDLKWPGTFHLYRPGEPFEDFKAAYQAFAPNWNMMAVRDDLDWNTVKSADPFKGESHAFLYKDEKGKPAGYFVFEKRTGDKDRRILGCKEMVFDSFSTLKALMAFAKTFAADYEGISFQTPFSLNLGHFCQDYPQSETTRQVKMNGMARAVHAGEVLRLAGYKGSGSLSLYLHDDFLPNNNGLYHIAFENDKAKEIAFTPLPLSPFGKTGAQNVDIEMTINVFSAAILGNYQTSDFEYMDGVKIYASRETAYRVFYAKPCWIHNYF
jgi:predicted acetyltransferase